MQYRIATVACALAAFLTVPTAAQERQTYIKAGRLFDGRSEALRENVVIGIAEKKIVQVATGIPIPAGAEVIDLGAFTLMPGMIDAQTHIALHSGDYDSQILRETPEFRAIWATLNAKKTLEAGITTIRDLGNEGAGFADIALRGAVNRGFVPGPRIVAAIQPVTTTGAYRLSGYSPYVNLPPIASIGDGPAELRKQVRRLIEQGADVIKVYIEFAPLPLPRRGSSAWTLRSVRSRQARSPT